MPRTPDRHDGDRSETAVVFDDTSPTVTSGEGELRYAGGVFRMRDAIGEFDPRAGATFGTQYDSAEDETETSTTSTGYTEKLSLVTAALPVGSYLVFWYFEVAISSANNTIQVRVQRDNTTDVLLTIFVPSRSQSQGMYVPVSGFDEFAVGGAASFQFDIDYGRPGGGGPPKTVYARNARIVLWRVS